MYRYTHSQNTTIIVMIIGIVAGIFLGLAMAGGEKSPTYQTMNDLANCLKDEHTATCQIEKDGNEYEVIGTPKKGTEW